MSAFADLHVPGRPLFLPNAWDVASAAALVRAGFSAIGTTSLGVAAAAGEADGAGAVRSQTLALVRGIARLRCLVTVDLERGFSDDPRDVADLCGELAAAGAVGVNIEDGLADPQTLATLIGTVKKRVPDLFVNARTDTYWLSERPSWTDTVERVRRYAEAGADGLFVPGLLEPDRVRELASSVRLNVLYQPAGPTLPELAALGVARVSTGSLLFRTGLGAAVDAARALAHGGRPVVAAPSYAEVASLAEFG